MPLYDFGRWHMSSCVPVVLIVETAVRVFGSLSQFSMVLFRPGHITVLGVFAVFLRDRVVCFGHTE
jgi:hypothetical protein